MQKTYFIVYSWGVLANILLASILMIISGEIKTGVFKKNMHSISKYGRIQRNELSINFRKVIFLFFILASWIYTSFLCLLIFVKIFRKKISPFNDIYENCFSLFSNRELEESHAFIVYFLMEKKEILYSRNKALEYIWEISRVYNYPLSETQVEEIFNSLGL